MTAEVLPAIRKTGKYVHPGLTPAQQREIQKLVTAKASAMSAPHKPGQLQFKAIYRTIKDRFHVGSYKDVPADRFNELVAMLEHNKAALDTPDIEKIVDLAVEKAMAKIEPVKIQIDVPEKDPKANYAKHYDSLCWRLDEVLHSAETARASALKAATEARMLLIAAHESKIDPELIKLAMGVRDRVRCKEVLKSLQGIETSRFGVAG